MDKQEDLGDYDENLKFENIPHLETLKPNPKSLEEEKRRFIETSCSIIDSMDFEGNQCNGRPRFYLKDILKSLVVMSYNGMSYRRTESDLFDLKEKGLLTNIPKRSTLNKYMMLESTKKIVEKLIQALSLFFIDNEDTIILDSTWLASRMYSGGHRKVYDRESTPLQRVRKVHIACLKNSRVITCAKATIGTVHDNVMFKELVLTTVKNGFHIRNLLADAGYTSKDNYAFCKTLNITNVFIDFRKNASSYRSKSDVWRKQLRLFKKNPEIWHESYRFRVVIEQIFSSSKRKLINYLRARKGDSQDCELLLKCLVYNFMIVCKFFY